MYLYFSHQNKIADMALRVESARLLTWRAAHLKDSNASHAKVIYYFNIIFIVPVKNRNKNILHFSGSRYGQVGGVRGGHVQRAPVHTGVRRHGLRVGYAGREVLPRCQDNGNLRRNVRDPEDSDRCQRVQRVWSVDKNKFITPIIYLCFNF